MAKPDPVREDPQDVETDEMLSALRADDFPASAEQLARKAQARRAPAPVVEAIRRLPEQRYDDLLDVERTHEEYSQHGGT
jgi:hypothetical protein